MKEDRASKQPMLNGSPKKIQHKVYKIVLTGGPCGGKTTGQVRLSNFFENLGWKVYRAPETAFVLMSGGVKWTDLDENQAINFQEDIGRMMLMVEDSYTRLAEGGRRNAIIICDRGVMDGSAFLRPDQWQAIMARNGWNPIMLRDQRYNQIIHMVSAAEGAEEFYTTDQHATRYESSEQARELDKRAAQAWVGHPYYDVVDNSTDFETKVTRMIGLVCERMGIQVGDRLARNSIKRKFLVKRLPPGMKDFSMPSGGGSSSEKADAEAAAGAASDEESSSQVYNDTSRKQLGDTNTVYYRHPASCSDVNRTSPNSLNRRLRTVSDCGLGPQEGAVNGLDDRRYDDVHGVKNPRSPCTPPPVE
ncbi:PREDICTED: uncharacterized protein LOC106814397 [Priapulus caudatus]|uniref:Uncharacterized protein LOC106814397 n=1 Tax=Priapulus caudatus TaxID=37621 RepID=A0ABM1EPT0_PRICU|nr:PREDICTED: uncharacterized protein LOC106814397 [Priapulus caudatus]